MHPERKYLSIAALLREELAAPADARARFLASERELTRRFGVDRSTVRRALNLLEEEGLIRRRPGRKTELLTARTGGVRNGRVACIINACPRGWATLPLLNGAEAVLTPRAFDLTYHSSHAPDPQQAQRLERQCLEACLDRGVSGVLLWPASRGGNRPILERLLAAGIPVVTVDQKISSPLLDYVGADHVEAGYTITRHLIRSGHTSIAHVTRANPMPSTVGRIEGYLQALVEHGLPVRPELVFRCRPGAEEEAALDRILASPARPTAIFGVNDMTALRLLHALQVRGIRVPEELALAGIDDLPVAEYAAVPLTTLHQPFEEIGKAAAALLAERIGGNPIAPTEVILSTHLVARRSCGFKATGRNVIA